MSSRYKARKQLDTLGYDFSMHKGGWVHKGPDIRLSVNPSGAQWAISLSENGKNYMGWCYTGQIAETVQKMRTPEYQQDRDKRKALSIRRGNGLSVSERNIAVMAGLLLGGSSE